MTKEQERAELHRTIWAIAEDLRGSVDGWDFKSYVLGILFYRFISENVTNFINKEEAKDFLSKYLEQVVWNIDIKDDALEVLKYWKNKGTLTPETFAHFESANVCKNLEN